MRLLMTLIALTIAASADDGSNASAPVTFNKDVLPILQRNCQTCHRPGNIAPMSFLTYETARPWAKAMKAAVVSRKMPPWFADPQYGHFSNDRSLTRGEIEIMAKWADSGAAQGDAKDAPAPLHFADNGWTTQPDMILKGAPYKVPAAPPKNVVEWADVYTPGNFSKDTWVTSIEIKPSELGVTHHICTSFVPHNDSVVYNTPLWVDKRRDESGAELPPSERKLVLPTADGKGRTVERSTASAGERAIADGGEGRIGFVCYVPGRSLHDFRPHKAALRVPAGYDVVWQIHYTPNGKEVTDLPELGLTVAKEVPDRIIIETSGGGADVASFAIPPNDPNYEPRAIAITFMEDAELVWMGPHMHLRGKDMTYKLVYPDGKVDVVLSVPHYDFNWQLGYDVAKPIKIPKGAKLVAVAHYDNSPNNKFNPDPSRTVYYGNMTWEEMFSPFFAVTVDKKINPTRVFTIPFRGAGGGA